MSRINSIKFRFILIILFISKYVKGRGGINFFLIEDPLEPYPALIIPLPLEPYPALTIPLPASIFPNKLASNVPNNILRKHPFCSFASFLIVSLTPSNNNPGSSRALTIFIMSSISSFDIISAAL